MEERVKKLEMIVARLARRERKRVIALITPYPISGAVFGENVSGSVLRYMFPCEGTITKGLIRFEPKLKDGVKLTVHLSNVLGGTSKEFLVERKNLLVKPDIKIEAGDCLDISVLSTNSEELIKEVWISFLWIPTVRDVEAKSYLIDELETGLLKEGQGD